uniref:G-type lectin S-receptor-like serine/threonine-protein kinase SD2-5 n=1 Tax=Vitis vinifera TaxID=29760 RepID=F6H545_VITVI
MHLLNLFQRKVKEDQMLDLVDKSSEDMQLHGTEVVEMMKLAAWCLQNDIAKRPSMSVVVKVLDGVMDVEGNLDYCFFSPQVSRAMKAVHNSKDDVVIASTVLPSILSGPR